MNHPYQCFTSLQIELQTRNWQSVANSLCSAAFMGREAGRPQMSSAILPACCWQEADPTIRKQHSSPSNPASRVLYSIINRFNSAIPLHRWTKESPVATARVVIRPMKIFDQRPPCHQRLGAAVHAELKATLKLPPPRFKINHRTVKIRGQIWHGAQTGDMTSVIVSWRKNEEEFPHRLRSPPKS